MPKLDFRCEHKALYAPAPKAFSTLDVPVLTYFMIDGAGDPHAEAYHEAVEALYAASSALKALSKAAGLDYVVSPLESLWWTDDGKEFPQGDRSAWRWTAMIAIPDAVSADLAQEAIERAKDKKALPALGHMRMETLEEGRCAQILHVGPYTEQVAALSRLHHEFLPQNGFAPLGKHHEIYLTDPRRTAPEKLKTILRQPVVSVA
jgi:hypothetical protein